MKREKVPVTMRALVARINRKLVADDEVLKISRGMRTKLDCGEYWILNFNRNWVARKDVDPEELGRKLGVLKPWEEVQE